MIFDTDGTITTVFQEKASLQSFLENLHAAYPKIRHDHLILNLFSLSGLRKDDLLEFLDISQRHRAAGRSFVLVTDAFSYDEVPEELCLVPSLQEARDVVDMEEMERDLGL